MTRRLGVIGGSGLYQLPGLAGGEWMELTTPWGRPSDQLFIGWLGETELAFLPRHGRGHAIAPHEINYRANIAALKQAGCTHVLAVSACGSFREELPPGTFVVIDQYDDRTRGQREPSFFGGGIVAHAAFAEPVCPVLSGVAADALAGLGLPHQAGGTFVIIDGPRFSTRAESIRFRADGGDVIGMTGLPEANLAREAELPYACVACVTDFDAWHSEHDAVDVSAVVAVLRANAESAKRVVAEVARLLPLAAPSPAAITRALDHAIITPRDLWPEAATERLRALAPRLFG
ncbi:MAG: S-methyl-5'-thioadenosine phosphorylase [Sphingomonadaceae bacterium]|nr:S-methyl-5'-thioadenosine phosphorylase [Sphingomonadaceae bacterium]